jgi:hypothetical protein
LGMTIWTGDELQAAPWASYRTASRCA